MGPELEDLNQVTASLNSKHAYGREAAWREDRSLLLGWSGLEVLPEQSVVFCLRPKAAVLNTTISGDWAPFLEFGRLHRAR